MWTLGRLRDCMNISHSAFCFLRFVLATDKINKLKNHQEVMRKRGNREIIEPRKVFTKQIACFIKPKPPSTVKHMILRNTKT